MISVITLGASACTGAKPTPDETIQGASQKLRQAVSSNVREDSRRNQMLTIINQIEATQRGFAEQTARFVESFRTINADYEAPRAAFDKLFAEFNVQRVQARDRVIDLHFQLTAIATTKEWERIGKAEAKMYGELGTALAAQAGAQ
jgi:hypothetical protein